MSPAPWRCDPSQSPSLCLWAPWKCPPAGSHHALPHTRGVPCLQLPHTVSFVAPLKTRSVQHTTVHLRSCFPPSEAVNDLLFKQQFLKQNQKPAPGQMCARPGRVCYLSGSQTVCYANKPHALFSQPPADFATNFVSEENTLSLTSMQQRAPRRLFITL